MQRKLASVQKIREVSSIAGADRIELVKVLGWQCVTQKSNGFKPDSLVVYFEVDSVLAPIQLFEFLRKKPDETSFRLKTIRLKGKYSQGLVLPLSEVEKYFGDLSDYKEGDDLTDLLGVTKYEAPVPAQLAGKIKGQFPYFVPKTDETRIQSCPGVLERHRGKRVYVTEKIDGSSMTVYYYPLPNESLPTRVEDAGNDHVFGVCSRSLDLVKTDDNAYWKIALKYDMEAKLKAYGKPLAIQGEVYGLGVQGNKLKQDTIKFAAYNIYDLTDKRYLNLEEFTNTARELDIPIVPIWAFNVTLDHNIDSLVVCSMIKSAINPDVWAEGIVVRPIIECTDDDLGRLSFKAINPEFLIKFGE
jgi:RNA ligase (TIGR02306 family)